MSSEELDSEVDDAEMKQKTIEKIKAEIGSDGEDDDESGNSSDDSDQDTDEVTKTMNFDDSRRKGKSKTSQDEPGKGIMGLKFMQKAE